MCVFPTSIVALRTTIVPNKRCRAERPPAGAGLWTQKLGGVPACRTKVDVLEDGTTMSFSEKVPGRSFAGLNGFKIR